MNKQFHKTAIDADKLEKLIEVAQGILWHWKVGHINVSFPARNCMIELEEALKALKEGGE